MHVKVLAILEVGLGWPWREQRDWSALVIRDMRYRQGTLQWTVLEASVAAKRRKEQLY